VPPKRQCALVCRQAPFVQFCVRETAAVVGRFPGCDCVLVDASVSRRHAEIRAVDEGVEIVDLRSRNGSFIGNKRIQVGIATADEIVRFGDVEFTVSMRKPSSEEVTDEPRHPRVSGNDLSKAQRRVFELLLEGHAEKTIARKLGLSQHTVHNHTRAIYTRFGVHSRAQMLVVFAKLKGNG